MFFARCCKHTDPIEYDGKTYVRFDVSLNRSLDIFNEIKKSMEKIRNGQEAGNICGDHFNKTIGKIILRHRPSWLFARHKSTLLLSTSTYQMCHHFHYEMYNNITEIRREPFNKKKYIAFILCFQLPQEQVEKLLKNEKYKELMQYLNECHYTKNGNFTEERYDSENFTSEPFEYRQSCIAELYQGIFN